MGPNLSKISSVFALFTGGGDSHHRPVLASLSHFCLIRVKIGRKFEKTAIRNSRF